MKQITSNSKKMDILDSVRTKMKKKN